jgi:predicted metal-dependent hydrolase
LNTRKKPGSTTQLEVQGLQVTVVRKAIKRMNLRVCAPDGWVRVAAPLRTKDEAVRALVLGNLEWISKHQERVRGLHAQVDSNLETGEELWFQGQRYRLQVVEHLGPPSVALRGQTLELLLRPGASTARRRTLMNTWYRDQLLAQVRPLLDKWQPLLEVHLAEWGVKRMRTRWGSCSPELRRMWLNLELARKPLRCLEYVVVHELTHLHHRNHDAHFYAAMDRALPHWRDLKAELNSALS